MWGSEDYFHSEWIAATLSDLQAVEYNASHFPHNEILTEYEQEGEFAATEQDLIFEPIDLATPSIWRDYALRVIEIHDRFRQKFPNSFYPLWALEIDDARRTWNRRFVKLLAMIRRATRRILLAHNVKVMRELWLEYRQCGMNEYVARLIQIDPTWDRIMELVNPFQMDVDGLEVSQNQFEQLISTFAPRTPLPPSQKGESSDSPSIRMAYAAQDLGKSLRSIVPFFMKPGPLSIADSIVLRDLKADVRASLLTIDYRVGLEVFRNHDRTHQVALSMTDGILRSINETEDPTETVRDVRGFWADSKQWIDDLRLALRQEQIRLDEAKMRVPDDIWHLFEFLDFLEPYIDQQHENPTWSASSQDRPALDEDVKGLWSIYRRRPWAGPLSPVVIRAFDRLRDVMHQYSNSEMIVGLGVPEWKGRRWSTLLGGHPRTHSPPEYPTPNSDGGRADVTYLHEFHDHQQAEGIRMLQHGEEPSYRVRRRLQITEAMIHLQIRLLDPDVHDRDRNSEMTRRLCDFATLRLCQKGPQRARRRCAVPQVASWRRQLDGILIDYLLDAVTNKEETNPTTYTAMPEVWQFFVSLYQQTAQELEAANVSDAGFLVGIGHALVKHEDEMCCHWGFDEWQAVGVIALLDRAQRCVVLAGSPDWMRQHARGRMFIGEFWLVYRLRKKLNGESVRGGGIVG
ncbi:hypothetical protein EJ03DRAFT_332537 [Teratosphaeria nubilosa]|uniref:Uncharacterized protein n=1 Tax=Teratosphaeria nubilosa TaxID=161662 RepID=A0A6G1KU30_9PEZI|nr:hypothetical protein EJ03DRAFT_332537 [Teratosphaeria nubilosa]